MPPQCGSCPFDCASSSRPVIGPWLAHAYTASGAVLAFLAARDAINHQYRAAFVWLALQVAVDATDGVLARRVRAGERLPWFSGAKLDDIIDYLTYVFVPALIVWRAILVPDAWALPVAGGMLVASAYGFSRTDAKTRDHFFTGFPSYWNIVVFYLFLAGLPPEANGAILVVLAVLVFVPIRYVYPSRTPVLQTLTVSLGILWAVLMAVLLWQFPRVSGPVFWASLVFPAYYTALSLVLHVASKPRRP
jgi:phosphatidylcholine synthase